MTDNCIISLRSAAERFRGFSLNLKTCDIALLPDAHELVVNVQSGYFTVIGWNVRHVINDGTFTQEELPLVLTLLHAWPSFVENGKLLQVVTKRSAEKMNANHEQTMNLFHRLVEECRHSLRPFGIEIENIGGQGYKLSPLREGAGE